MGLIKQKFHPLYVVLFIPLYVGLIWPFLRGWMTMPGKLQLGFFDLRLYAVFILVGIMIVAFLVDIERRNYPEFQKVDVAEALIWVILPGIIGARLWHVMTDWSLYIDDPIAALNITHGGLGIFGALIFGSIGLYLYARRVKMDWKKAIEIVAIYFPLAHFVGRLGNLANQELYGYMTDVPWAQYIADQGAHFHPAFLYEQIGNLLIFAIVYYLYIRAGKVKGDLRFVMYYVIGYSLVRFFVDIFRTEPGIIFGASPAQVTVSIMFLAGVSYLIYLNQVTIKQLMGYAKS